MPIGVIVDALAVFLGGLFGYVFSNKISNKMKNTLTLLFGLSALAMGVNSVIFVKNLPVIILSLIVGTVLGITLHFEEKITRVIAHLQKRFLKSNKENQEEVLVGLVTIIVLFCASANGIYGSLDSGFSGEHTILISKAILDFFTALIFGCNYGAIVSIISIPQFIIYLTIFFLAKFIFPLTSATMIADFKGCGGLLMIATGFRIMKLEEFPLVDMIPSLIVVMPLSYLWSILISL